VPGDVDVESKPAGILGRQAVGVVCALLVFKLWDKVNVA